MTTEYEKFIAFHYKELDNMLVTLYFEYMNDALIGFEDEEDFILFENNEEWYVNWFIKYASDNGTCNWYNAYNMLDDNISDFRFKEELIKDYLHDEMDEDDDTTLKQEINLQFTYNYLYYILTFEYFKNLLYEKGIYNEIFADDNVCLK